MPLAAGTRLGPYEIAAPLGAGGMGEVYRARDTRLGREVAIKGLPEAFAQNAERLARFEREARLLASLNHPNIAGIFGLEDAAGTPYLVLELVEGETLAQRLARGPLSVRETLEVCGQIAGAIETAHERAIVTPTMARLSPELHPMVNRAPLAPRRWDVALVWPLEAPMIDPSCHRLFREVRIESGTPLASDLIP